MEIKNSIVTLQPGMYILRHPKGGAAPLSVSRAPDSGASGGKLATIATQKTNGTVLRDGADCIVMHITEAPVDILVTAFLPDARAATPALKIDQIGLDAEAAPPIFAAPAASTPRTGNIEISDKGISIIGHIERTGDVLAGEGQRVGQPASDLRLEGFQVMWPDRPEGVDLAYSVALEGIGVTPIVSTGTFCGSKGEARRITEVTFALIGSGADKFSLEGTAYFSGGFQVPVSSGMALSGPSGLEHLTALVLSTAPAAAVPAKRKTKNPWDESPQTKVFKTEKKVVSSQKSQAQKKTINRISK